MYKIALCDDDPKELKKTQALLDSYKKANPEWEFFVSQFTCIDELESQIGSICGFDLLLMDIYMPGRNGMEGAKKLRESGFKGSIIFLTTSREHALDAFGVSAAQYLIKPPDEQAFFDALDTVREKSRDNSSGAPGEYIPIKEGSKLRRIPICDILYSEAQNQYQCLHLASGEIVRSRMTSSALYALICKFSGFVRVGSVYIVNLEHVDSLAAKELTLDNGSAIWLPRGSYRALKEQYLKFYRIGAED